MTRESIPGAWFADALPTGEFVISTPGQPLQTDRGPVPLPPGETLQLGYLALSPDGTKFAGQPHSVNRTTFEYVHGFGWGTLPFVTGAGIYDAAGNYVDLPGSAMGMGFLTDDGLALKATETYGPHVPSGLFNWTQHAGFVVGAPLFPGLVVYEVTTGTTRMLDASEMAPIRPKFHVRGDKFVIVYTRANNGGVQVVRGPLDELRTLPVLSAPTPPVDPVDPPPPPPPPPPPEGPNMLSTVQAVRAKYPTPLGARHAAFLLEVAKATGKGLLRKDGGTNIELPDGTRVAQDIVMERDGSHHYDILGDGEGAATPGWDDKGPIDASRYYDVGGASVPTDPTGPTGPSGPDHDEVLSRLRSLESAIGEIRNRIGVAEGSADAAKATATHMFEAATTAMAEMRADISKLPTGGGGGLSEADVEDVIKQYHVTVNVFGREYSAPLTKKKRA